MVKIADLGISVIDQGYSGRMVCPCHTISASDHLTFALSHEVTVRQSHVDGTRGPGRARVHNQIRCLLVRHGALSLSSLAPRTLTVSHSLPRSHCHLLIISVAVGTRGARSAVRRHRTLSSSSRGN